MKHQIFSVYDKKAESFLLPFYLRTVAEGIRAFATLCKQPDHNFCVNSEDYTLYHNGEINDEDASFEIYSEPKILAHARDHALPWGVQQPASVNSDSGNTGPVLHESKSDAA